MSQTPTAFASELPANLRCGFCGRPIEKIFYRTFKRFACANCAAEAEGVARRNEFNAAAFTRAALAGLGVALLGAIAWATIEKLSNWEIGFVAVFIGVFVGRAVFAASGKRRGAYLQWLSAILAVGGVAGGKLILGGWMLYDMAATRSDVHLTPSLFARTLYLSAIGGLFGPMDLLWNGFAAFAAWRLCKPLHIPIAGPFIYQPTAAAGELQFNTVEPAPADVPNASQRPM